MLAVIYYQILDNFLHLSIILQPVLSTNSPFEMKFRAVMIDTGPMREFTNIVATISKLSKECILKISEENLYFIVSEENCGPSPPVLWCVIPQRCFFTDYQMVGVDEEHKDIYLEVSSAQLARSLSTLKQAAKCIKIKLTKKQCPCLTLEIELPSSSSMQTRHVTHDIPVTVVARKACSEYKEPNIPESDIEIELPSLKQLRVTIERMRTMCSDIVVAASAQGKLTLQIKTDMAKVSTGFQHLRIESFKGRSDSTEAGPGEHSDLEAGQDGASLVVCRVDIKKLSMFLCADQISHNKTICSIIHNKLVSLCLHTEDNVRFQCFIPGICY